MLFAIVSVSTLIAGIAFAVPAVGKPAATQARREITGGSLLATGLMLLGAGLQSAGG
jgi:hypothetical protein